MSKKLKRVIKRVTFFGFSACKEGDINYVETYETAKLLAENGYIIVNGGFTCTMEAGSRGAKDGGSSNIAVTFYPEGKVQFEGGRSPNRWVDQEIKTRTYIERTLGLINLGDAYIVFNGGTGTVSEFAMVWSLAQIYFNEFRPLILFGDFWYDIVTTFQRNMLIRPTALTVFDIVNTPEGVLQSLQTFARHGKFLRKILKQKK